MSSDTCQVCGSDLNEYEFHENITLHGPVLGCITCGLLYFRRCYSFISSDGHIALQGKEGDPFTPLLNRLGESSFTRTTLRNGETSRANTLRFQVYHSLGIQKG